MKKAILLTFVLVCMLPSLLLCLFERPHCDEIASETSPPIAESNLDPTEPENDKYPQTASYVTVSHKGSIQKMPLEEYVMCVVLAEMPAEFDEEALKAQAVVARTYTCKKMEDPKHENAQVCTDSSCCQAFMDADAYLNAGGTTKNIEKVRCAVEDTASEVLTFQGELIEATYFSCSGGKTEDAAAVWGSDVPYLQSVESPGEEQAAHYTDTVRFSTKEFCSLIGMELSGNPESWIEGITYTSGGGVSSIVLKGSTMTGTQMRQKLGLRSTAFVITITGKTVTVTTKGFGHRVGMSQYGADAMAVQGSSYRDILFHYYTGTSLSDLSG